MQFSILSIAFILQFHGAFASPTGGWQLMDVVGAAGFSGQNDEKGYECGNDFFSDSEIREALSMYHHHVNRDLHSSTAYQAQENSKVQQHPNVTPDHKIPQEDEDFDVLQYLNLEEFDVPLENNIPQEYQNIQHHVTPEPYRGPLYSDSAFSDYILWPIQKEKAIHSPTKCVSNLNVPPCSCAHCFSRF